MKNPLITMSAVTGKPSMSFIQKYMKSLIENGIEQVMIYPRSGCELEYLSNEWFDTVECFLKCAKQLDMYIWLYDDFNWPSGDAGGRVSKKYQLKSITTAGENIGEISTHSRHNGGLFRIKNFPDLLSYDAVDYFINVTHEQYYRRFKEYFGSTIKGIFTDEPSFGYCCNNSSVPYYEQLPDDYKSLSGGDFYDDMKLGSDKFYENVMLAVANRFKACFVDKIRNWCEEHSIYMCGHLMAENEPYGATFHNGNLLTMLSSFSVPGVDEIVTNLNNPNILSIFGAAQYARKGTFAMAELFALGPCDMSYALKKSMIFYSASFKINLYFLAVSHMDMRGNKKILDYFNDFSISQPDFSGMKLLANEAMLAAEYADKDFTPDVYVEYPSELCAANLRNKDFKTGIFIALLKRLSYYQIQWKFINKGDNTNGIKVIRLTENSTLKYADITASDADEICKVLASNPLVRNINGELSESIFVRKFDDGSFIVINLDNTPSKYVINGIDKEIDGYGVVTDKDISSSLYKKVKAEINNFNVNYCNENIIRCMFVNSQDSAIIKSTSKQTVKVVLRNDSKAYIDNEAITTHESCTDIPYGMQSLYKASAPITLCGSSFTIKSGNDYKYMPSVLIKGSFDAESISGDICQINLLPRKNSLRIGDYISGFGKVELSQKVFVPEGAKFLQLNGTKLYTCILINGEPIGEKICSPYIYKIDNKYCGKIVNLKIIQYSSIAPILGDVEYWDKHSENVSWKGTKSPQKTNFGVSGAEWLI